MNPYKHYAGKQEIFESIIERMNQLDAERFRAYAMPESDRDDVIAAYRSTDFYGPIFLSVQYL